MTKIGRDLLRAIRPLVEREGGTVALDDNRLTRHHAVVIRIGDQERWVPYSISHDIPEAVVYHTRKKVEAILREMRGNPTADKRDPRKRG